MKQVFYQLFIVMFFLNTSVVFADESDDAAKTLKLKFDDFDSPESCERFQQFLKSKDIKSLSFNEAGECIVEFNEGAVKIEEVKETAEVKKVAEDAETDKSFLARWNAELKLNGLVTKGNKDSSRFGTEFTIYRQLDEINRLQLGIAADFLEDNDGEDFFNWIFSGRYDRKINERRTAFLLGSVLQSDSKNIDMGAQATTGYTYSIGKGFSFSPGVGVRHEETTENSKTDGIATLALRYDTMLTDNIKFGTGAELINPISSDFWDDYRAKFDCSLSAPISETWSCELKATLDRHNNPIDDAEKNDFVFGVNLGKKF